MAMSAAKKLLTLLLVVSTTSPLSLYAEQAAKSQSDTMQSRNQPIQSPTLPFGLRGEDLFSGRNGKQRIGPKDSDFKNKDAYHKKLSTRPAFACVQDLAGGVWNATGGQAIGLYGVVRDPVKAWNEGVENFKNLKNFLFNIQEELETLTRQIGDLDEETKSMILCTMIGEIGVDVLIATLSSGAATPKLMMSIERYVSRLRSITNVLKFTRLSGASTDAKRRMNELIRGYIRHDRELASEDIRQIELMADLDNSEMSMDMLECAMSTTTAKHRAGPKPNAGLAKYCGSNRTLATALEPRNIQSLQSKGLGQEYSFEGVRLASYERARNLMMNFPMLERFGFSVNNPANRKLYTCRHPSSPFNGKPCGWEMRNENGDWARLRLDNPEYTPDGKIVKDAHFNLEMTKDGKTYKYSIQFDCRSSQCTPQELERLRAATFGDLVH